MAKTANKKTSKGYRLHKERILFSGGKIIRTIKFPLTPVEKSEENEKFLKNFENAIIADSLKIRGDLNLNDYIEYSAKGNIPYTLFDFWIDSLRAGVIWMSKPTDLIDFISNKYNSLNPLLDTIWNGASERITNYFDKEGFKSILLSNRIRSPSTKVSLKRRLIEYLKEEYRTKSGREYIIKSPDAQKEIDFIVNSFFDDKGNLKLDGKKQNEFWKREYGLDKSIAHTAKPEGKYKYITFLIIPELVSNLSENTDLTNLITLRENWLGSQNDKVLASILGLTNNFNGFSNYFGIVIRTLQDGDARGIYEAQKTILPEIENKKDVVLDSLNFLSKKSNQLGKIATPAVTGWHDYRSLFGGKLQSWFTNSQKRKKELDEQISDFDTGLDEAIKFLNATKFSDEANLEKIEIIDLLNLLKEFFVDKNKSLKIDENFDLFNLILSLAKRQINFFYQAYIREEGDETKINKFPPLKSLYEKIYKPVAFYGDSARKKNKKIVEKTIPIIEDGSLNVIGLIKYLKSDFSPSATFENVKKKNETPEDCYRKFLQFFWNKYSNGSVNSTKFLTKYEEILRESTDDSMWQKLSKNRNGGKYIYYRSPFAKGALHEVQIKNHDFLSKLAQQVLYLTNFLESFKSDELLNDVSLLLEWIELSKKIISLLLRFNVKENYEFNNLYLENFTQAKKYLELFANRSHKRNEFGFVVQSLILAELRGSVTTFSQKEYTARYSTQIVFSDKKFKLFYFLNNCDDLISHETINSSLHSDKRKQLMRPHFYALSLRKIPEKKKSNDNFNSISLTKEGIHPMLLNEQSKQSLFRLASSPYQLQFLDKYIYRPKGWENVDITLGEWGFVVEKRYKIDWDMQSKRPVLSLSQLDEKAKKKNKIYVFIPFNLEPDDTAKRSAHLRKNIVGEEKADKDFSRIRYPVLGVDVGEYGLAYCLVRFNYDKGNNNYQIVDLKIVKDAEGKEICGFVQDKNIANIKDKFAEIQQRAREGVFEEEDTIVARVRENAIGALRNKIHWIITKQGASAIYEDSISNFETGSGRTTKIYNSIKRADTESGSPSDDQIREHVWGKKTKLVGRSISAYASSYTCVQCLKSLYQIKKSDLSNIVVEDVDGRILTLSFPYGEIKAYLSGKDKKYKEKGYRFKETEDELKTLRKFIRDFTRPPVKEEIEVLEKYAKELLVEDKINEFKKKRGNSFIFVCPFCQFVADADIQAAFMMAVRGYLRFSGIIPPKTEDNQKKDGEKTTGESFLEQTIKILEHIDRSKIIDALSLKL